MSSKLHPGAFLVIRSRSFISLLCSDVEISSTPSTTILKSLMLLISCGRSSVKVSLVGLLPCAMYSSYINGAASGERRRICAVRALSILVLAACTGVLKSQKKKATFLVVSTERKDINLAARTDFPGGVSLQQVYHK